MNHPPAPRKIGRRTAIRRLAIAAAGAVAFSRTGLGSEAGSETRTGIIDAHVRIGTGVHLKQDVDDLLHAMDEAGVSVAVACFTFMSMAFSLVSRMKELPNLWLCLSGPTQWGIQTLDDKLGPEKLLFGSDGGRGGPPLRRSTRHA